MNRIENNNMARQFAPGAGECAGMIGVLIWTPLVLVSFVETINYGVQWGHDQNHQDALSSTSCFALDYAVRNGTFQQYDCPKGTGDCQWNLYLQINGSVQFNYTADAYARTEWVPLVQWSWPIPWSGICPPGFCNTTAQVTDMFAADYPLHTATACWFESNNAQYGLPLLSDFSAPLANDRYWCLFALVAFLALALIMAMVCVYVTCTWKPSGE